MTLLTPDIEFCACAIYADLSQHVKECSLSAFFDLCEKHEKPILFDRSIPPRQGGMCIESNIILSPWCTLRQYTELITHELVHALADSPRWDWLNSYIQGRRYRRDQFLEAVAGRVGKMFVAHYTVC